MVSVGHVSWEVLCMNWNKERTKGKKIGMKEGRERNLDYNLLS